MVRKYKVRVYEATAWGAFTQADHYQDYFFESDETLERFANRIGREGFAVKGGQKWIMPASILTVEYDD